MQEGWVWPFRRCEEEKNTSSLSNARRYLEVEGQAGQLAVDVHRTLALQKVPVRSKTHTGRTQRQTT